MKVQEIKERARKLGIEAGKMKKTDMIRAIQKAEGNTPCFGSGTADCPYLDCCWRKDCLP